MTDSADALLALEHATAEKAVKQFRAPLLKVLALLTAFWPGDNVDDATKQSAIGRINLELLLFSVSAAQQVIINGALNAYGLGIANGKLQAKTAGVTVADTFKRQVPDSTLQIAQGLPRATQARFDRSRALLKEARTLEQAQQAVVLASPHARVEAAARQITNMASNDGLNTVAESEPDLVQVWIAERDACVHCLAYQGHRRIEGGYPAGLTFGKKPVNTGIVFSPPLHPNCRCSQLILEQESAPAIQRGLIREAKRSVLRGWSVESEAESIRVDAARRLLAKNPAMPKSVEAYARSAVKDGAFARGNNFPGAR